MNEQQTIATLAYALWQARGCPEGSSKLDWAEAERQVMATRRLLREQQQQYDGTSPKAPE